MTQTAERRRKRQGEEETERDDGGGWNGFDRTVVSFRFRFTRDPMNTGCVRERARGNLDAKVNVFGTVGVCVARAKPAMEREREKERERGERENKESELDGKGGNERERERESGCYGDREGRGWLRGGCERRGETVRRGKERLGKLLLSSPPGRPSLSLPVSFSLR